MKHPYRIQLSREEAILYLKWEFGVGETKAILDTMVAGAITTLPDFAAFLREYLSGHATRRQAEKWADKIRQVVAYQRGRAKQPLRGSLVSVIRVD